MAKTKKFYVVWVGSQPGIYDNWQSCQEQIKGFPNARYKSFKTMNEAQEAFSSSYQNHKPIQKPKLSKDLQEVNWQSIAVDAACSGNPGVMEYRGVETRSGKEIFRQGPFEDGTNNIGEFLALVHALALLDREKKDQIAIYSDSRTAMSWVRNKKVKTTLKRSAKNKEIFRLLERAETWIKNNTPKNKILKWETDKWGEIPADFGRK